MEHEPDNSANSDSSHSEDQGSGHQYGGMGHRGVSRPMAEMQSGHQTEHADDEQSGHSHEQHDGGHTMSRHDRLQMLQMHHKQTLWVYWTLLLLGFWTAIAPVTFGYANESLWVDPSGGRGAWWSSDTQTALRANLMIASDAIAGLALVFFAWRSLLPNRPISLWACCLIGVWLTAAPVLFWAPTAAAYYNDTIVGALVIALSILIPGMPNMVMYMQMGPATPPGWSYNPSSWPQRWIMIVTAFAGWLVSRYLATFQLGYTEYVWDPFFGFSEGTKKVLNSNMSHMWPISDAALGSLSYTFEFLMGYMGSPSRWRTMPWMVAFFGFLVIPLGLTHIILVISQPVVVGHWCAMCLLAAAIMLPMIPLEVDEVIAMGQHMVQAKRRGDRGGSLWEIFWMGGSAEGCTTDERSPALLKLPEMPWKVFRASIWGMSFPWTLTASTLLGLWLMFSPTVFGVGKPAAHVDQLAGALVVTISVISMGEVVRLGRYFNILLGLVVAVAPWSLSGPNTASLVHGVIVGLSVAALAIPCGTKTESYGLWDQYIR